ncbi:MAG: alpha-L-fucosidase, partial [Clostridia bacterium]|nr:alpha-L-fucosidase [Clostridia bacterium]
MTLDERLVQAVPSPRQLAHQQTEFYAFIHFTVNAFTDREWGDGTEDPAIFNPEKLDAEQWAQECRAAGMRGIILTCKHHDGFCL